VKNAPTIKHITLLSFASLLLASASSAFNLAQALEYECTNENDQRFISLDMPGEEHLCEVSVTIKEGERDVKWYANSESAFCTEKTEELKGKYENLWGFNCTQWPDTDGIDALSKRHRVILDAELKKQIALGQKSKPSFVVKAVKASASKDNSDKLSLLALQFFSSTGDTLVEDVTHIIHDNGVSWFTHSRVKKLASYIPYIPGDTEYKVNSALISAIDNDGTIEVSTMVSDSNNQQNCYGAQTFLSNVDGSLIPRAPHRFVCQ